MDPIDVHDDLYESVFESIRVELSLRVTNMTEFLRYVTRY
jgi:hypothetical protein